MVVRKWARSGLLVVLKSMSVSWRPARLRTSRSGRSFTPTPVAVWVAPNLEYYEIDPPAHPRRKAWSKPHPDVVGYSHRDHANRVGHWRMADAMSARGFPGSVSLSVALCDHIPEVVADAAGRGWEFFSHGIYNTRYTYGMDEAQEREFIRKAVSSIEKSVGVRPFGWLSRYFHTDTPGVC